MARQPINVRLGQGFGQNPNTYASLGMRGHNGWDYPAPLGTPVVAPESGQVSTGYDARGYGNHVTLQGDSGWQHKLAHFQRFGKTGRVNEGDVIGYVNSTGFSTGNHLHWGTRPPRYNQNNGYYGFVDPQIFLNDQKGASSLPYSDEQYKKLSDENRGNKAAAIGGLYWRYMGRPAEESDVKAHLNEDINEFERKLQNPDDPASDEHRNKIKDAFQKYFGRQPSDKEIRQRTPQDLIQIQDQFENSDEHKRYMKNK